MGIDRRRARVVRLSTRHSSCTSAPWSYGIRWTIRSRWPGPHASVLMRAAYAAEDAGEIERALALGECRSRASWIRKENARERIEALMLKARNELRA